MIFSNRSFRESLTVCALESAQDKAYYACECFIEHLAFLAESGQKILPDVMKNFNSETAQVIREIERYPRNKELQKRLLLDQNTTFFNELSFICSLFFHAYEEGRESLQQAQESLLARVEKSGFKMKLGFCFDTGQEPLLMFKENQIFPFTQSFGKDKEWIVDSEYFKKPKLQVLSIPLPSGELLMADFFRFNFLIERSQSIDSRHKMESSFGREQITVDHAKELGMIFASGSEPDVVLKNGELQMGYGDPEVQSPDKIEHVSESSLRWYSIIDKLHLAILLAEHESITIDEAKDKVENYIKAHEEYVTQIKFPSNQKSLNFYCSGSNNLLNSSFESKFQCPNFERDKTFKSLWAVLSDSNYSLIEEKTLRKTMKP